MTFAIIPFFGGEALVGHRHLKALDHGFGGHSQDEASPLFIVLENITLPTRIARLSRNTVSNRDRGPEVLNLSQSCIKFVASSQAMAL